MTVSHSGTHVQERIFVARTLLVALAIVIVSTTPRAQSFSSGSDGSDGALTVAASQGTIIFDPRDTARWGRVLDPDGDGVYNFTTITIGLGTTLKLRGDKVNTPMYWLASGDVVITGILDLSGANGTTQSDLNVRRQVAVPGSGGYAGGARGFGAVAATPGSGPGGGSGGVACTGLGAVLCGKGGVFSGNRYLVPLVGGSGGEGALAADTWYYGGGAGGGAILVASSTAITIAGTIAANGGMGGTYGADIDCNNYAMGGGGSGGAVRLVAPTLSGSGSMAVSGGCGRLAGMCGGSGWVRLEAYNLGTSFHLTPSSSAVTSGMPFSQSLRPISSIRVTAVDGIAIATNPSGSFVMPDATISKAGPVNVDIQATGIPPGRVITLQVYPENPVDLTIVSLPTAQATLAGTLGSSTATATFTFPYGLSRGFVRASWTQ
jgi:hypothetical protein